MKNADGSTKTRIYVFDTSAFSAFLRQHLQVIEMPKLVWDTMENMLKNGTLISHEYVFNEVVTEKSEKPDLLTQWLLPYKASFAHASDEQLAVVAEVVKKSPKLIDSSREKEQADPWIIAQAAILNRQLGLFEECEYVIVTQENKHSPKKIPLAAKNFNVECISLKEFFDEINVTISAKVGET